MRRIAYHFVVLVLAGCVSDPRSVQFVFRNTTEEPVVVEVSEILDSFPQATPVTTAYWTIPTGQFSVETRACNYVILSSGNLVGFDLRSGQNAFDVVIVEGIDPDNRLGASGVLVPRRPDQAPQIESDVDNASAIQRAREQGIDSCSARRMWQYLDK